MTEPMSGHDNPTPSRNRRRMTNTALIVAIGAFVTAGILIVGVSVLASSFESTVAEAKQGATATSTSTVASTSAKPAPATQPGLAPPVTTTSKTTTTSATPIAANKTAKEAVALQVDVGDCVILDPDPKKVGKTACGSPDSTYKVVDKAGEGGSCPSDADHSHSVDKTTLCLDIDWTIGSCMTLKPSPTRIPCTASDGVKVVAVKQNTTEVDTCPNADRGFVYSERKFVICFADL
ncbi:hypothetical protein IU485_10695 [Nocardia cyriacigeorgica]|uniref:LppU/SCO3897 family protein n=1 Tax=Nocardia cyriacigeorgica TaxID=135487 RepID=UPI00189624CF|nr:hypothetical protein [Nocardia cyriacigeorgica]MBF6081827.1 hypothetical protein [Nocardia cyriacigeorgica]BDU08452.1 hypothetical protein FMUBM48_47150 [Nocardia cyriacigeorgica]